MLAIILAALLWGTTGTAATLLPPGIGPLAVGAATMGIGGLLLSLTAPRAVAAVLADRAARPWLIAGGSATAVYPLAFYSAMQLAGVAIGNVVALGSAPVFAVLLELVLEPAERRPRLTARWMLSGIGAVVGMALLSVGGHGEGAAPGGTDVPLGIGLGLLAGLSYAGYSFTAARLMREGCSSRGAMASQFAVAAVVLLPLMLVLLAPVAGGLLQAPPVAAGSASAPAAGALVSIALTPLSGLLGPLPPLAVLAYLALGPMFLAYVAFGRGLRTVSSSRATTVTLIEPFVATLLAIGAVGERLAPLGWIGLALVLAGVVLTATEAPSH